MRYLFIWVLLLLSVSSYSQEGREVIAGKVSFVTSANVYVKFASTAPIKHGDTLYSMKQGQRIPCLRVTQKSSTSCVCLPLADCVLEKGYEIVYIPPRPDPQPTPKPKQTIKRNKTDKAVAVEEKEEPKEDPAREERLRARMSASSSSYGGEGEDWNHRVNYRLSFDADHIAHSAWSAETYMNYRQRYLPAGRIVSYPLRQYNVYSLAVSYEPNPSFNVLVGRKINYRASSLGAIDGVQVNKSFGKNFVGAIVGFRPDIYDYGLNTDLLQYGAYLGRAISSRKLYAQTTLGVLEQRNKGLVDRRYAYFQHSSSIGRSISLFGSFEVDLYKRVNDVASNDFRLTNMYLSGRYRFSRRLSVSLSYDSRKRILQYETFKTEIEKLLEDDEARQGARVRINFRPFRRVYTGVSYSKRFQNSRQNASGNINGFISWSRIPWVKGRLSARYNHNTSSYLTSDIWSVRHSRSMFKRRLGVDMYFRWVDYAFINSEIKRNTKYYGLNLSFRFTRRLTLSVLGELSDRYSGNSYRLNTKLIRRFDRKRKRKL